MKFCPSCGSQNDPDSMFCVICGEVLTKNSTSTIDTPTQPTYTQPGVVPTQGYPSGPTFLLASWFARFAAFILDVIVVVVIIGIIAAITYGVGSMLRSMVFIIFPVPLIFVALGYGPIMEHLYGATIGKMILKIKVVDVRTGQKPDLMKSIISNLGKMFLLPIDVILGLIVSECAEMNQRIFQRAVDLVVIQNGSINPGYT